MHEKALKKRSLKNYKSYGISYIAILPFFLLFFVFVLLPMLQGIARSFTDWSTSSRGEIRFVAFDNYFSIFSGKGSASKRFLTSLQNLMVYVPITVLVGLSTSLILAIVVNEFNRKAYNFFRGSFFIPTVLPLFLCAGIWKWYMATDAGLISSFLASLGIGKGIIWQDTPIYATVLVIIIDMWHAVGFNFVIISTGLRDISPEYYEAAEIDGASTFQKIRYITLPLLEPIMFFVITYAFISALQVYDIPWILTQEMDINAVGGANNVILFPVMEMVRNLYAGGKSALGRAAAEGVVLMILISIVTSIQFKLRKKRV